MGNFSTKSSIETSIKTNWTASTIQWDGVSFSTSGITNWIGVKYIGVSNNQSFGGRSYINAQLQVMCYAKSSPLCFKLADDVSTLLSCKQIGDIEVRTQQVQGSAVNLDNGYFELMTTFEVEVHS